MPCGCRVQPMKTPLTTCIGEDGRAHGCVIKLFLWLNTQKHAKGGQDICMSQCRINSTGFPCRIPLCPGWCQSPEVGLHVPEETYLVLVLACLKTYGTSLKQEFLLLLSPSFSPSSPRRVRESCVSFLVLH